MKIEAMKDMICREKVCRIENVTENLDRYWRGGLEEDDADEERVESDIDRQIIELAKAICADEVTLVGHASEIHNLAVGYARKNYYDLACAILKKGLSGKKNFYNIDLLADYLKYSVSSSDDDFEAADEYYHRLKKIDQTHWNWRAYDFCIDYLLSQLDYSGGCEEEWLKESMDLALQYKSRMENTEHEDKAYYALAEVYLKENQTKQYIDLLHEAMEKVGRAPMCAAKLSEYYFKLGDTTNAEKYILQCKHMNVDVEASVSMGYPYVLLALCHMMDTYKDLDGVKDNKRQIKEKIDQIEHDYNCAKEALGEHETRVKNLRRQITLLKKQAAVDEDDEDYDE